MNQDLRINLEHASVLLLDSSALGMAILAQIFAGFGAKKMYKCGSVDEAKRLLEDTEVDLIILNDQLELEAGFEVVRWIRKLDRNQNAFASVILVSGHIRRSIVQQTRDCGANFLVAKPLSPQVMLERVVWVAREKRPFLETDTYVGPDRRFHTPTPEENQGRRKNDGVSDIESALFSGERE